MSAERPSETVYNRLAMLRAERGISPVKASVIGIVLLVVDAGESGERGPIVAAATGMRLAVAPVVSSCRGRADERWQVGEARHVSVDIH